MTKELHVGNRRLGLGHPVYFVAEISSNHNQSYDQAVSLLRTAKEVGATAVKLQTYTPDTLTIRCSDEHFRIGKGTLWEGRTLYDLYAEAYMPWEWQPKLKRVADDLDLDLFSTPFDKTAVDFLEAMEVPAYKVASFEIVDLPLIEKIASTGKPMIISTGMATLAEIDEAVQTARTAGAQEIALLKCSSAYPASPEEMNLRTIPHLAQAFDVVAGLSDHTLGIAAAVASVALGASIIEKHITLSRATPGPDSAFSLEPGEFRAMTDAVREAERALGRVSYEVAEHERPSRAFRRSLFVVEDIGAGEVFTEENVRSIRPGYGLLPKYLPHVLGRRAAQSLKRGTPLTWEMVA